MPVKFDYPQSIKDADELITYFGMDAVLRREGSSPLDRPCRVVVIKNNPREKPSELANPVDSKVIMSASNSEVKLMPPDNELDKLVTFVQPAPADRSQWVEEKVRPLTCKPEALAPGGITVIWEFTVRQ